MLKLIYSKQTTLNQMSPHFPQNFHNFSIVQHFVYIIGISVLFLFVFFCLIADKINEFTVTLAHIQLTLCLLSPHCGLTECPVHNRMWLVTHQVIAY